MVCIAGFAFATSFAVFGIIAKVMGLRASEANEMASLDIAAQGMFGYPERFIEVIGAEPEEAHSHVGATLVHRSDG